MHGVDHQTMIVDIHVHISNPGNKRKSFFEVKDELLDSMKKQGIRYSIVIPDNFPNPQCADMDTVFEILKDEKQLFALGTINIFKDKEAHIVRLDNLLKTKKIHGIKLFPGHEPFYPTDKRCEPVYELCIEYGLPVVIHTGIQSENNTECAKYNDPKHIIKIAQKHPKLAVVIAHFFWPKMDYCYELTKDIESIYYDTSAMADPEVLEASGGFDKVRRILEKTVLRKPSNVVFGTDWPICSVRKHRELIKSLKVSQELKDKIFSLNAIKLYRLGIP